MFFDDEVNLNGQSDVMIVSDNYVVALGLAEGYCGFFGEGHDIGGETRLPAFHVLKPSTESPLEMYSQGNGHLSILPSRWEELISKRQPADIYSDRDHWNIVSMLYVPNAVSDARSWMPIEIPESFLQRGLESRKDGTLLLTDGPIQPSFNVRAFHAMPSQVVSSLWRWFVDGQSLYVGSQLYGRFEVKTNDSSRELISGIAKRLEDVFDSQFYNEGDRKKFPKIWN